MPARATIPDNAEYCINIDNKPVGKYCRNCGRFTYGASQHYTKEHKGTSTFPYKGAAPPATPAAPPAAPPNPPAAPAAMMAAFPPAPVPAPISSVGFDLASVPQISRDALLNRQANYDLGDTSDAKLEEALDDDDDTHFIAMLGKALGG
jgi:hypothetical protein